MLQIPQQPADKWLSRALDQLKPAAKEPTETKKATPQPAAEPKDSFRMPSLFPPRGGGEIKIPPSRVHLLDNNPKGLINDLRAASGQERYQGLMDFNKELNQMSRQELTVARDYLVELMASPTNDDDPFLGLLLQHVNQELDERSQPRRINLKDFTLD